MKLLVLNKAVHIYVSLSYGSKYHMHAYATPPNMM